MYLKNQSIEAMFSLEKVYIFDNEKNEKKFYRSLQLGRKD